MRAMRKRLLAIFMLAAMLFTMPEIEAAAAGEAKTITITPFEGQWKYYGQTRTFLEDEHYSLSENVSEDLSDWELVLASEEIGKQKFVLKGITANGTEMIKLSDTAPDFEIKKYTTTAAVPEETEIRTVPGSAVLSAPEGYLINSDYKNENNWAKELETEELKEGTNEFTYYLRSNKDDATRKAIDQTPKKVTIRADFTKPVITALSGVDSEFDTTAEAGITGNEAGMFYYIVVPSDYFSDKEEVTAELIKKNVASHYGIVGYGRLEKDKAVELSLSGLSPQTEYKIYAYMEDEAGNKSDVVESKELFSTNKMQLKGNVEVTGTLNVDGVLTATPKFESVDTGEVSYQWYRIQRAEDADDLDEVLDETGGAAADDLVAEDDSEEEDDSEGEEDDSGKDDEGDTVEIASVQKMANETDEITTIDGATEIKGATAATYKITAEDIGCRLIAAVKTTNYSGYIAGSSTSFVPKKVPTYTKPALASAVYSPTRTLASYKLPAGWSWVDSSIVPVYGNSGYRAKYVPADSAAYKTVIVRIPVPITKKTLKKSMLKVTKSRAYTGKAIKDNYTLKDGKKIIAQSDYKVSFSSNKNPGKATLTVKGKGNYKGTLKATFVIRKRPLKSVSCTYKKTKTYKGMNKKVTAGLVLKNGTVKMKKGKDYDVTYKNNADVGRATIVLKGKGNYTGTRTLLFSIVPKVPKVKKLKKGKTSFKLELSSRQAVSGYYIYVSTSSSFSKSKTQEYVVSGNRFGMKGLKKKTTYYIRAKAYSVKKGKTFVGGYCKAQKVKTK